MKADDYRMGKVFLSGGDIQFVLPIFQREYAWEEEEWQTLWDDIHEIYIAKDKNALEHFLGSLVVIAEDGKTVLGQTYTLVDGQQRLTSISVLLCALRDLLDADDKLRRKINRYLRNDDAEGNFRYKILPTVKYDDRKSYIAMVNGNPYKRTRSRIVDAYKFYKSLLNRCIEANEINPALFFDCLLSSIYIVFIELNRTDKPYKIFESLNHRGKSLTQADLVRNYIAMRLPHNMQQEVFDSDWSKIEDKLSDRRETARIPELTAFLRHYLALQLGDLPRVDQVYNLFRDRIEKRMKPSDSEFVKEIQKLNRFASFYDRLLRPDNESRTKVKMQLRKLNILEATTAYPLLMYFFDVCEKGSVDESEFLKILTVIENYLVRRFLAGEPTNYLNSMFTSLAHELMSQNEQSSSSLEAALGERNYPSDNRLRQRLLWNRLYSSNKSRRIAFVFEALNQHLGGKYAFDIPLDGGTVEHIMPQTLNDKWRKHLGDVWQDTHRELLHTIGNLTVLTERAGASLGNKPFEEKRSFYTQETLKINSDYFSQELLSWSDEAIKERAVYLAGLAVKVWPAFVAPPRSEGVKGTTPITLTVRDHHYSPNTWFGWRGMLMQMVNCLHELKLLTDFDDAKREFGGMIQRDKDNSPKFYKQSSAGWWIYVNHSAETVVHLCGKFANYCGLRDDEWSFTYE